MEEVKVREMQIFDYKKKIAEAETKLKQQQNLYEAVRSDRNLYSKNLIEAQVMSLVVHLFLFVVLYTLCRKIFISMLKNAIFSGWNNRNEKKA